MTLHSRSSPIMHLSVSYHKTCRQLLSLLDSLQLENCGSETARILIRGEHFTSLMCSSLLWLTPRCRRPVCHSFRVCVDADLCDLCVCVCVFVNSCTAVVVYHNKIHTKRPLKSHGLTDSCVVALCSNTDSTAEPGCSRCWFAWS